MTCNILYVSLFAFMFFARNVIAGNSINVPCATSEIDSDYRVVFDDSVLNHINLSDVALFLEKNYKHSVVYIDNRYIKVKILCLYSKELACLHLLTGEQVMEKLYLFA